MPTFTFKGFPSGAPVSLSALQGTQSALRSVSAWGQGPMASLDILTVSGPTPVAPAGIWFEAVDLAGFDVPGGAAPGEAYDPSFHEITYVWTVRGAPLSPYAAPENMVTGWNDPNLAYGKKVAFCFPEPGTYTIDLWAVDRSGTTAIAERSVTVADPDAAYPGTNTVCFSSDPGESWAGDRPGCLRAGSVGALQTFIENAPSPLRILFKRGQDVSDVLLEMNSGLLGHVADWGSGDLPILRPLHGRRLFSFGNSPGMPMFTLSNLDIRGGWDSTTETGIPDETPLYWRQSSTPCHYTVHGCHFSGFTALELVPGKVNSTLVWADNITTNWRDYGAFIQNRDDQNMRIALIGSRFSQHVDALNGGAKNGLFNTHGPVRYANTARFYMSQCDLFSRTGWSGLSGSIADQPCLRINTSGGQYGELTVERCVMEGGYHVINMTGQNSSTLESPGNYLFDRVLMIGTAKTIGPFIRTAFGGMTVRNVIGVLPDTPRGHSNSWPGAIAFEQDNHDIGNAETPMSIYSSSFVSLLTAANDTGMGWPESEGSAFFSNQTMENNLLYAPAMLSPVIGAASVDLSTPVPGVTPRYRGVLYNFPHANGTLAADVPDGGSFIVPYPDGTDMAYWQAIEASDTKHVIGVGGFFHASRNEIAISFEPGGVLVTNTSGVLWSAGTGWILRLDRKSRLPEMETIYANPPQIPMPIVLDISPGGLNTTTDFRLSPRSTPPRIGAIDPD